jgi:pimeloyl-ACP methyl ester carboxylesterase
VEGLRRVVASPDGVSIGLLTAGSGPGVLLVHGGMGSIDSWQWVWDALAGQCRVTAMDRRGRGTSGDADAYALEREYADVAAVAAMLADEQGSPVDVIGHSFGATCVLGAAALGAPFRRIVLYEPPGPRIDTDRWVERVGAMVAEGQVGRAVFAFLTEIVGLTRAEVEALRDAPGGRDALPIAAATLPREARALAAVDLAANAAGVRPPVLLLLGETSPAWAGENTRELAAALPAATVIELPGVGHQALYQAPDLVTAAVMRFLRDLPGLVGLIRAGNVPLRRGITKGGDDGVSTAWPQRAAGVGADARHDDVRRARRVQRRGRDRR